MVVDGGISLQSFPKEVSPCNRFLNLGPQVLLPQDFPKIHPLVQNLFVVKEFPQTLSCAGRIKFFQKNWQCLTQDPQVLGMVQGYQIPFNSPPKQQFHPPINFSKEEIRLIDIEILEMLQKGAIKEVQSSPEQILSPIFIVPKKDSGFRPVINLKGLNQKIQYLHFKMEGLFLLKDLLQPGDLMCKLDLKDAYFAVPLHPDSQKYVRFQWGQKIYQFLCLCFGLAPAPRVFTKLMKIPIAVMRRLNVRLLIFLDDILLMASSKEELEQARDTLIYLLQFLGFLININKSELNPSHKMQFLGMDLDSVKMLVSLPQEKVLKIKSQCQGILGKTSIKVRELASLVGRLSSSTIAILPAPLQYRSIQRKLIQGLALNSNYDSLVEVNKEMKVELNWWIQKLSVSNGRALIPTSPQMTISTDASTQGWGAYCMGRRTGGPWTFTEKKLHINALELKAIHIALMTFVRIFPEVKAVHIQTDNMTALSYLVKMGGTKSLVLTQLSKELWEFILAQGITITAEHLPGKLNVEADTQSRMVNDSSEWKLSPIVFNKLCQQRGVPSIDLFASRTSHQVPRYMSWKLDPYSQGRDAFQIMWKHLEAYAFPPFSLIPRVLQKVQLEQASIMLITPAWQTQAWYPRVLQMCVQNPILIPKRKDLLLNPDQEVHPLVRNQSLQLVAWKISGKSFLQMAYQKKLSLLSQVQEGKAPSLITIRPGESLVAGVLGNPFRCSLILILEFLTDSFDRGLQYNTLAGYRSAISAFHEPIDGVTVGKHPQVSALLTGVYNSRFPQPKYNFIWDVEKVVTYLQSLGSDSTLDDKTLTMKLTTLMALTSAARAHEICSLDIRFLVKHRTAYTFSFGKPTKTDKPGRKRSPLKFLPFEENKALCVCTCIENYLSRSSSWRDGRENQLLLSYVKPHIPVKSATVSRWLTCILKDSGIDVNIFSGHSTRSASTSKAKACGVPMKEILKRGHWSNITTFEKYYSKEIGSDETNFQKSILSGL